jgi:hypothetical protein
MGLLVKLLPMIHSRLVVKCFFLDKLVLGWVQRSSKVTLKKKGALLGHSSIGGRRTPKVTLGILDEGTGLLGRQLAVHGLMRSGSCSVRLIPACSRIPHSQGTPPSRLPKWPSAYAECLSLLPLETPKLETIPPLGMRNGSPPLNWDSPWLRTTFIGTSTH